MESVLRCRPSIHLVKTTLTIWWPFYQWKQFIKFFLLLFFFFKSLLLSFYCHISYYIDIWVLNFINANKFFFSKKAIPRMKFSFQKRIEPQYYSLNGDVYLYSYQLPGSSGRAPYKSPSNFMQTAEFESIFYWYLPAFRTLCIRTVQSNIV